jgi:hypothetical protein
VSGAGASGAGLAFLMKFGKYLTRSAGVERATGSASAIFVVLLRDSVRCAVLASAAAAFGRFLFEAGPAS